jgi:hypothetical protein
MLVPVLLFYTTSHDGSTAQLFGQMKTHLIPVSFMHKHRSLK